MGYPTTTTMKDLPLIQCLWRDHRLHVSCNVRRLGHCRQKAWMNEFLYENPNSRNKFYRHLPKISTVYYCVWTSYPLLYYHRVSFIKIHGTKLSIMIKQQAERDTQRLLWFWWEGQKLIPVKKIEWNWMWMTSAAWNELKLQVRETFSYTIVRERVLLNCFF